jgi:GTPase
VVHAEWWLGEPALSRPQGAGDLLDRLGLGELKGLLALVRKEYEPLLAARKTICLVGPVNTGKSSLYNALIGPSAPQAEVSPIPGTTRAARRGDAEGFWIIDTPGANEMAVGEEAARSAGERHAAAVQSALQADFLVIVFDAAHGIADDEVRIYRELSGLGKPYLLVLNKVDLVGKAQDAVAQAAARALQWPVEELILTSATQGTNLNRLLAALVQTDPQLLATLAELAPGSRWLLARNTILGSCAAVGTVNALTAPISIPFASFVPITAIQVAMVLKLARVFGQRMSAGRAKEVLATFGTGLLARTLFYQLIDVLPVAGWAVGTAVAVGTTMALGYSVATWFAYGDRLSVQTIRGLSEALAKSLVESFRRFPDPKTLRGNLQAALEDAFRRIEERRGGPTPG